MKTIQIILITILFLSLTSAITIIAGTDYTLKFSGEVSECYISNNHSNLEGLNFIENGSNVIIKTNILYKPDNFTISCLVKEFREEQSIIQSGGSSGSSCKYNKNYDWECSAWGECIEGIQSRECKKYNNCRSTYGRPNVTQSCTNLSKIIQPEIIIEKTTYQDPDYKLWHMLLAVFILAGLVWIIKIIQALKQCGLAKD